MSLIADALKKAQAARLGRRYHSPEPSGVLPVGKEGRGGGQTLFGSALSRVQLSPTLLLGMGSGLLLFFMLITYFFYGRGTRVKSPTAVSPVGSERRLILTPPPVIEPLALEKAPGKGPVEAKGKQPEKAKPGAEVAAKPERPKVQATPEKATREIARASPGSRVSVAVDLSEEVRYRFNLALFYQQEKNFPMARREYERVVEAWPFYAEAHNNLGVVYKELGMYDDAVQQMKKALALNPRYAKAYHNLGAIYQLRGDLKQATKSYETALSLDPRHLGAYNNLSLVYRAEKRPHDAIELLEKALAIDASYAQTHYNLALLLEEVREMGRARIHYQKFVDLSADGNSRLVERVRAHLQGLAVRR